MYVVPIKNKQSFVGIGETFDVLSEGPLCGVTVIPDEGPSLETLKFSLYFSGSCIPTNERLFLQYHEPPTISPGLIYFRKRFLIGWAYIRGVGLYMDDLLC